jgi:predicted membrane-bound mannosyltransferase
MLALGSVPVSCFVFGRRRRPWSDTVQSWPLLVLAAPAAAEVVRVGRHRAEDRVRAGIPAAGDLAFAAPGHRYHPPGVEAHAAYALRAWLAREDWISDRTRRFAN